jgi:hypothetical protein
MAAAFDEQGRLYVADSSGSNDKVEKQLGGKAASHRAAGGYLTATGASTAASFSRIA